MNNERIADDAIFKIGRVISVDGRVVKVAVDKMKNSSHLIYQGGVHRNIAVGGYVKISKGFARIIGKVDGEYIGEDLQTREKDYASGRQRVSRTLVVKLLGFLEGNRFERGIKELPLIDNECFLLHRDEVEKVHDFLAVGDDPITIGTLAMEKGQDIRVGVNSLLASHIGIFGNTGSGKSYTLAKIYRELLRKYKDRPNFQRHAKFFLIDFNGEYVGFDRNVIVEPRYKNIYELSTRLPEGGDRFPISHEMINDPAFWVVFLEATEKTQTPFLNRALSSPYLSDMVRDAVRLKLLMVEIIFSAIMKGDRTIEKGIVVSFLRELNECLGGHGDIAALADDFESHLQFHNVQATYYYESGGPRIYGNAPEFKAQVVEAKVSPLQVSVANMTPIDEIRLRITIQYYQDIIRGFSNREHLAPLIKRLDKRVDDLKKVITIQQARTDAEDANFTIVSLREVNIRMRKILPLMLCKKMYDARKEADDEAGTLNLIVDEAHNILSEESERESEQWKDYRLETFEEIIKEGRKYGVFLTIASQRPHDISPTIISQLHNYFLHRLINNEDIKAVERSVSYLDKVSFEALPILPTGTCILAGLIARVPVVVEVGKIEEDFEPNNKTVGPVALWQ
ncbi:MAG: ATP-binding protein [Nitrospirae bacterium]|nr:ATP-binding protein [Nitrospirota bacterium]